MYKAGDYVKTADGELYEIAFDQTQTGEHAVVLGKPPGSEDFTPLIVSELELAPDITSDPWDNVAPASVERIEILQALARDEWASKPWFGGVNDAGSPVVKLRAHEVLGLIERIKLGCEGRQQ